MVELFKKYGGESGLREILTIFHERVVEVKEIRHFLFNVTVDRILKDQIQYMPYILSKADRHYRGMLMQTGPMGNRIGAGQFEDVANHLRYTLKDLKVDKEDIHKFAGHILELIEETRAQSEDLGNTVFKPIDVSLSTLDMLFTKSGLSSKVGSNGDISIFGGVVYPFHVRLNTQYKTIKFIIRANASDGVTSAQVQSVIDEAKRVVPMITYQNLTLNDKPCVVSEHTLPYQMGIPTRLLIRVAVLFSEHFSNAVDCDTEKYLKTLRN